MKLLFLFSFLAAWSAFLRLSAAELIKVSASNAQTGNGPAHAIDTNQGTRWSSEGKGQWLLLELDKPFSFSEFELGFSRGARRYGPTRQ